MKRRWLHARELVDMRGNVHRVVRCRHVCAGKRQPNDSYRMEAPQHSSRPHMVPTSKFFMRKAPGICGDDDGLHATQQSRWVSQVKRRQDLGWSSYH